MVIDGLAIRSEGNVRMDAEMEEKWVEEFEEGRSGEQIPVAGLGSGSRQTQKDRVHLGEGPFWLVT
jgi:hypothetical protein